MARIGASARSPRADGRRRVATGLVASSGCGSGEPSHDGSSEAWAELTARARVFQAVGDPARLAILCQLIEEGQVCGCGFDVGSALAQPTVSHHLRVLREAGLVTAERRGVRIYYRANPVELARSLRPLGQPAGPRCRLGASD